MAPGTTYAEEEFPVRRAPPSGYRGAARPHHADAARTLLAALVGLVGLSAAIGTSRFQRPNGQRRPKAPHLCVSSRTCSRAVRTVRPRLGRRGHGAARGASTGKQAGPVAGGVRDRDRLHADPVMGGRRCSRSPDAGVLFGERALCPITYPPPLFFLSGESPRAVSSFPPFIRPVGRGGRDRRSRARRPCPRDGEAPRGEDGAVAQHWPNCFEIQVT